MAAAKSAPLALGALLLLSLAMSSSAAPVSTTAAREVGADEQYSPVMARAFATLAKLAYCGASSGLEMAVQRSCGEACQDAGFEVTGTPSVTSAQAGAEADFALISAFRGTRNGSLAAEKGCVVAFRGSSDVANLYQGGLMELVPWEQSRCDGCKVHRGFAAQWEELKPGVLQGLSDSGCSKGSAVYVTGHSSGAAMATLAMYSLQEHEGYDVRQSYTFEAPRVGDGAFATAFGVAFKRSVSHFAVCHQNDEACAIPAAPGYAPAGFQVWYSGDSADDYVVCGNHHSDPTCGVNAVPRSMLCPLLPALCALEGRNCSALRCGFPPAGGPHCRSPLAPADNFCDFAGNVADVDLRADAKDAVCRRGQPMSGKAPTPAPTEAPKPPATTSLRRAPASPATTRTPSEAHKAPITETLSPEAAAHLARKEAKAAELRAEAAEAKASADATEAATAEHKAEDAEAKAQAAESHAIGAEAAESSAKVAEQQARVDEERAEAAASKAVGAEEKAKVAKAKEEAGEEAKAAKSALRKVEADAKAAREQAQGAESKARDAEGKARAAQDRATEAQTQASMAEAEAKVAEDKRDSAEHEAKVAAEEKAEEAKREAAEAAAEKKAAEAAREAAKAAREAAKAAEERKAAEAERQAKAHNISKEAIARAEPWPQTPSWQCFQTGVSHQPLDMYGHLPVTQPDAESCQAHCARNTFCTVFTYFPWDGSCHINGRWAYQQGGSLGAVSGPANCMAQQYYPGIKQAAADELRQIQFTQNRSGNASSTLSYHPVGNLLVMKFADRVARVAAAPRCSMRAGAASAAAAAAGVLFVAAAAFGALALQLRRRGRDARFASARLLAPELEVETGMPCPVE